MKKVSDAESDKRLMVLAAYLSKLNPRKFYFGTWFGNPPVVSSETLEVTPGECGTNACALGHAATMPYFNRLGLKYRRFLGADNRIRFELQSAGMGVPRLIKSIFGSRYRVQDLFYPSERCHADATPKHVAKRIREFVRESRAGRARK